jgi:hypothetical protein
VGGEEKIGGRMPLETQRAVREAQRENGSVWRKEEVRPGGLEDGAAKENGPRRETAGLGRGNTSDQAMQEAGPGAVAGLKRTRAPKSMDPPREEVKRCQSNHQRLEGSGREASPGCLPRKWQQQRPSEAQEDEAGSKSDWGRSTWMRCQQGRRVPSGR